MCLDRKLKKIQPHFVLGELDPSDIFLTLAAFLEGGEEWVRREHTVGEKQGKKAT